MLDKRIIAIAIYGTIFMTMFFGAISFAHTTCCGSMYPAIHNGDYEIMTDIIGQNLVGHIVVYQAPWCNCTPMHRVIAQNGNMIEIKGDNNSIADGWFNRSVVKDEVIMVIHV